MGGGEDIQCRHLPALKKPGKYFVKISAEASTQKTAVVVSQGTVASWNEDIYL